MHELDYEITIRVTMNMNGGPENVHTKRAAIMINTIHPNVQRCWRNPDSSYTRTGMEMFVLGLAAAFKGAKEYVEAHKLSTGDELFTLFLEELQELNAAKVSSYLYKEPKQPPPSKN